MIRKTDSLNKLALGALTISCTFLMLLTSVLPAAALLVREPYLQLATPASVTIVWRTNLTCSSDSRVMYGTDSGNLNLTATGTAVTSMENPAVQDHIVTITGLSPGTQYFYDVGTTSGGGLPADCEGGGTLDHFFLSAPSVGTPTPFTAWVVGDSGNGSAEQMAVRQAMLAETGANPPNIFLPAGDNAYDDGTDGEFTSNHFAIYQDILRHTPSWPTLGNHEARSVNTALGTGPYYEAHVLPTGGEAGGVPSGTEAYYSFDYANAHFIVLDSMDSSRAPGAPMLTWLQADLSGTAQEWVIALFHHPPYTKGTHNSDECINDSGCRLVDMRENVLPILEAGGVDLVLGGHSHIYERSYPLLGAYGYGLSPDFATPDFGTLLSNGNILDTGDGDPSGGGAYQNGTVYVVAGHGGKSVNNTFGGNHPVMFFSEAEFGSVLLDVNGTTLTGRNVRTNPMGQPTISDTFSIQKIPGGGTQSLTVTKAGTGGGTVTSAPAGIACGATCAASFTTGQGVTLTATPDGASTFGGWTGDADCTDGQVTMTGPVSCTATFTASGGGGNLLTDAFADGNFDGWQIIDEVGATHSAPSVWAVVSGALQQSSNIYGGSTLGSSLPKPGTFAWYTNGLGWSNYHLAVQVQSIDNDALGVMVRYQNPSNYYRFSWDAQRSYRRLVKVVNGTFTLLAQENVPYVGGQSYQLEVIANGNTLDVRVDGAPLFGGPITDNAFATGSVALYSWGNQNSIFDAVVVNALGGGGTQSLTVTKAGTGGGTVTSAPAGIACGATCAASFTTGQGVTLTATPDGASTFGGWTGDADCTNGQVTMTGPVSCTATFTASGGGGNLLTDAFADGNFDGWQIIDEVGATHSAPSVWAVVSGALQQSSNIYGGSTLGSSLPKPGTFAWYTNGLGWSNYHLAVQVQSTDNDALGVMVRYQNPNNYYRFSWDAQRSYRRLVKVVNGTFTLLAQENVPYVGGQSYQLEVIANGNTLDVRVDGAPLFGGPVTDNAFATGSVALYSWGNQNSIFDAVVVNALGGGGTQSLTVTKAGTGGGTVTSAPAGIACGATCAASFTTGQGVTLTATPDGASTFGGWTGDADCTDGQVTMTGPVSCTATFTASGGGGNLLTDAFADGNFDGWQIIDEVGATHSAPSVWAVVSGALQQSSNIYGGSTVGSSLPKPGTFAWYTNGLSWSNYHLAVQVQSTDNDALGVMVRYQNPNNYYRFSWDAQRSYRRLVKVVNGTFTLLAQENVPYVVGQSYQLEVIANGNTLDVRVDGAPLFGGPITDNAFATGSVALYSWGNQNSIFDAVVVNALGGGGGGFTAYNDLAWGTGQLTTNITTITSPNGGAVPPLDSIGQLVDYATGLPTPVRLEVTGGSFIGDSQAAHGANPVSGTDAHALFNGKVTGQGAISYIDQAGSSLVLTFTGLDPSKVYDLAYYANRNQYAWDRASLVTLSGQAAFTNISSEATDNPNEPGGVLFTGPNDTSTRLPADNDNGYVARFSNIDPGNDGAIVLTISYDGTPGSEFRGKYGSAVRLQE